MKVLDLLTNHDISAESFGPAHKGLVKLRSSSASPAKLRSLGFRLGRGLGQARYLLYYRGRFCGIIL